LRLGTFFALGNREFHSLALVQCAVTRSANFAVGDKDISTLVPRNKTIPFGGIKPLDSALFTLCHVILSYFVNNPVDFLAEPRVTAPGGNLASNIRTPAFSGKYISWDFLHVKDFLIIKLIF
jgi:hypothetical protein